MPRMSKKRRLEWAFFLNERNRITFNALCRGCTHDCKQSFRAIVVLCPRYYSKRWKARPTDKENQDYQLVEKMGGSITVESLPGKGTEFMLLFPLES